jgi:hypothetical protein
MALPLPQVEAQMVTIVNVSLIRLMILFGETLVRW